MTDRKKLLLIGATTGYQTRLFAESAVKFATCTRDSATGLDYAEQHYAVKVNPSWRDNEILLTFDFQLEDVVLTIRAKFRTTLWPDTVRNARRVDEFLWRGSHNLPLVQRIGAWIFGLTFLVGGCEFVSFAKSEHSLSIAILGLGGLLIGAKVFGNGCRRRKN